MVKKKMFPDMAENISVAMTPMVLTARFVKKTHPGCKVVFVGPCDAKKLEASRRTVRSDVDFVLTFEEVLGMFAAKGVDKECIPAEEAQTLSQAGSDARKFAVSGGVAQAVVNAIKSIDPTREVKIAKGHRPARVPQAADDGPRRQVRRLPSRGYGVPRRLRRRRRHAPADRQVHSRGRKVRRLRRVQLRLRYAV